MVFEKNSRERQMFADYYKLCQKWWDVTNEQLANGGWNEIIQDMDDFAKGYVTSEDRFAVHLSSLLINRIESKARGITPLCKISDGSRELIKALVDRMV